MKMIELKQVPENLNKTHKLLQQDLVRPEVHYNWRSYIINRYKWLNEIFYIKGKLDDGRDTVSFYGKWAELTPEKVNEDGTLKV